MVDIILIIVAMTIIIIIILSIGITVYFRNREIIKGGNNKINIRQIFISIIFFYIGLYI